MTERLKLLGSFAALALILVALITYEDPTDKPAAPSSTPPAAAAPAEPPARITLDRAASYCSPDPLAGRVDVRIVLVNRGGPGTVDLFVKRSFAGGNDDGNALDLAEVRVEPGRTPIADTYDDGDGHALTRCRLWLDDRFVELPIEGAA